MKEEKSEQHVADINEFKAKLGAIINEAYSNSLFLEGDNIGGYFFIGDKEGEIKYTSMIQDLCEEHDQHWQEMELNFVEIVESLGLIVSKV